MRSETRHRRDRLFAALRTLGYVPAPRPPELGPLQRFFAQQRARRRFVLLLAARARRAA